jgi:predicted nucleic acid-binding protein
MTGDGERPLLVDASVFITLAEIEAVDLLNTLRGSVAVPDAVADEIRDEPGVSRLDAAVEAGGIEIISTGQFLDDREQTSALDTAATHLGESDVADDPNGDVALLALGLAMDDPVAVTDDKPLRKTCKALGVPLSGSIGVVIVAVERDAIEPKEAKRLVTAMDEVGARLSARLFRRAERLIDGAHGDD